MPEDSILYSLMDSNVPQSIPHCFARCRFQEEVQFTFKSVTVPACMCMALNYKWKKVGSCAFLSCISQDTLKRHSFAEQEAALVVVHV